MLKLENQNLVSSPKISMVLKKAEMRTQGMTNFYGMSKNVPRGTPKLSACMKVIVDSTPH